MSDMEPQRSLPTLALVLPCFNEREVLHDTIARVRSLIADLIDRAKVSQESFACFVDDGSSDETWSIISWHAARETRIAGLRLTRNFGHQSAVLAGLFKTFPVADCIISIDADLQQDPSAIETFVASYVAGADIVLGIRNDRGSDSFGKMFTAEAFYTLMKVMGVKLTRNHADYRLMSKRAAEALTHYGESNLFLRGLIHHLGFKVDYVYFDVFERRAGKSKYNLVKMLRLAIDGITSFSIVPLRCIGLLGLVVLVVSVVMGFYILVVALGTENAVPGWASTVLPIYLLSGMQLLSIGVLGEYVGKIYLETKRRPRFLIAEERMGGHSSNVQNLEVA